MSNEADTRRAEFVYEGARLAAIAAGAPICTHDFVLWNGNVECHNCDQIWVHQPTVDPEADTRGVAEAEVKVERVSSASWTDTRGVEPIDDDEIESLRVLIAAGPVDREWHRDSMLNAFAHLIARIDAEVALRREAERERDQAKREQGHLIATLDESHALIQRLRAAIKQSMDESGCAGCIAKNMPCPPCEPLAAALDREGELTGEG